MIKISTKGKYGTRLMLDLALNYGNGPILLKDIAKRQEISEGYLEQIMPSLKNAGLLNSARGAHGGYTLAEEPSRISLIDIVTALEGAMSLAECVKSPEICNRAGFCATRDLWEEMSSKMKDPLKSKTLEDLVKKHKGKNKSQPLNYSI